MIRTDETICTDERETQSLRERFHKEYHGEAETPDCRKCGKTTHYIVEALEFKDGVRFYRPGVNLLFKLFEGWSAIPDKLTATAYIPVKWCGCE